MHPVALIFILIGFVLPMVLGAIAILTEHQRRLAEIRQRSNESDVAQIAALQEQMSVLTELVHQQTIALDSIAGRTLPIEERISARD
jgi:hypothetical protein